MDKNRLESTLASRLTSYKVPMPAELCNFASLDLERVRLQLYFMEFDL